MITTCHQCAYSKDKTGAYSLCVLLGKNVQENMTKIEEIMSSLSLTEVMQIDEYLTTKFFDK